PALVLLAAGAVALAFGRDVVALIRPWLKPHDAQTTLAIVAVAKPAIPELLIMAGGPPAAAPAPRRAPRARAAAPPGRGWGRRRGWGAGCGRPGSGAGRPPPIGRAASLQPFMARLDGIVPADAPLYAIFTPDVGLRFYAPRRLEPWRASSRGPAYLLLWEDERKRWRDEHGKPLEPLAGSEAQQASHGALNLVFVPPDATLRVSAGAR